MHFVILFCLCIFTVSLAETDILTDIKPCDRNDKNINHCIQTEVQQLLSHIDKGIPSINIPSFDPHTIQNADFNLKTNLFTGSITLKNCKTYGLSKAEIKDVRSTFAVDGMKFEIDLTIPKVKIEGDYEVNGVISGITLAAKGYFNASIAKVKETWKMSGIVEEKDAEKYLKINKFDAGPKIEKIKIYAEGLLPDPELNKIALQFFNQFGLQLYNEILPSVKKQWEPVLIENMNLFLGRIPFSRFLVV